MKNHHNDIQSCKIPLNNEGNQLYVSSKFWQLEFKLLHNPPGE